MEKIGKINQIRNEVEFKKVYAAETDNKIYDLRNLQYYVHYEAT